MFRNFIFSVRIPPQMLMNEYRLIAENSCGESVDLYNDGELFLTSAEGIDYEADIKTEALGNSNGSCVTGLRVPEREISLTVQYDPAKGNSERAKMRLHMIFSTARPILLRYISPNQDKIISGYCTKVNTPPNVYPMVTQIILKCPDPFWKEVEGNE